ncbi:hypothetical protein LGM65_03745 [Burkholderia anthina]|uniref:hypothetical protein n=1 Tax=Burkholderia anthina TaxID=179879 RepID=UPI001CF58E5C|nr:hypothetical protein [Burkholderia anthina]MCA8090010.1 hypothetical protein [Burkholderia anthina]
MLLCRLPNSQAHAAKLFLIRNVAVVASLSASIGIASATATAVPRVDGVRLHTDTGKPLSVSPLRTTDTAFAVAIPALPHGARPIIDDQSGACVGFIHEGAKNVWHILDVSGQCVGIEEAPLDSSLVDPYDLILTGSAALKLMSTGFNTAARLAIGRAAVSATSRITSRILPLLRSRLQSLSVGLIAVYQDNRQAHGKPWAICTCSYPPLGDQVWKENARPSERGWCISI